MYLQNDGTSNYKNSILKFDNLYIGPHSYLYDESESIRSLKWQTIDVEVLGTSLGARIYGVEPTRLLNKKQVAELKKAISVYKVIIISGFKITQQQHVEFSRSLGEIFKHPFLPTSQDGAITSFIRNDKNGGYENIWHNDLSWTEKPGMYAILNCIELPKYGGDTVFCDMYGAYQMLDTDIKNKLKNSTAVHNFYLSFSSFFSEEEKLKMEKKYPEVEHPVFPVHPITKKNFLYINKNFVSKINKISKEESENLVKDLCSVSSTPEIQYRHKWQEPEIIIWDNYSTQHYAVSDYWPYNRRMDRTTVIGPSFYTERSQ